MPRRMPRLDISFAREAKRALQLADAGVKIRAGSLPNSIVRKEFTIARLEALYEVAFLKVFLVWETFLEQSFYRYLCGHNSALGSCTLRQPASPNISAAETTVLGGSDYVSWANSTVVVRRAQRFMTAGFHETVLLSDAARLAHFTSIRNRIAHPSLYARRKFDGATWFLATRMYPGSSAGKFLRDQAVALPIPKTWLEEIAGELVSLAQQICA